MTGYFVWLSSNYWKPVIIPTTVTILTIEVIRAIVVTLVTTVQRINAIFTDKSSVW
jgi:hypothetical protein